MKDNFSKQKVVELIESAVDNFAGMNTYSEDDLKRWIKKNVPNKTVVMKPEELIKQQIDGYHELLGFMQLFLLMDKPMEISDIATKFKELNDKGLLPESLKHYIL